MSKEELRKEYIKSILSVVEADQKSVLLYVAFDLAVISLMLSEKVFQGSSSKSLFVAGGLLLLLISASLFFDYYRKMHLSTFSIVDQLLSLNTRRARRIPNAVWQKHKIGYQLGYVVRLLGVAVLIAAYVAQTA